MTTADRTALLVGHIQPPVSHLPTDQTGYFTGVERLLTEARGRGVHIVYLKLGFHPGYPELPVGSAVRNELEPHGVFVDGVTNAVDARVAPLTGDIEVVSPGPDIFARSSLASILRAKGIDSIAIIGVSTGGIVNGTVVGAFSEGLDVTVLKDLCFEPGPNNPQLFYAAFERTWGATITTSSHWLDRIETTGAATVT